MFNTCIVASLEGFRRNSPVFPYESVEYAYFPYSLRVCVRFTHPGFQALIERLVYEKWYHRPVPNVVGPS